MAGIESYVNHRLRARLLAGEMPAWLQNHKSRDYIVACVLSAPPWISRKAFKRLREDAIVKTITSGVPHVLGHIVPVTSPLVCGLTVPWNIHVIDAHRNAKDSNKFHAAFQGELLDTPEQLRMFL